MPVKLHYGPPGSYKTSGAIADDLPLAVKDGRVLITNIRGLNDAALVKSILNKQKKPVNKNFEIIYLDTKRETERDKLRRFYHWAPQDSYFILDEINTIWPKEWRAPKLKEFDLHNGSDSDLLDEKNQLKDRHGNICFDVETNEPVIRAQNLAEALEMHRHFNYDFSATSPSYAKFNAVFHEVAEMAYSHMNRAIIGLKGSYWESMHTADNNGKSKSDRLTTDVKKIPKWVFECYQSTATGEIRDSTAGSNIFLKPKVILPMLGAVLLGWYAITELNRTGLIGNKDDTSGNETIPTNDLQQRTVEVNTESKVSQNINQAVITNSGGVINSENATPVPAPRPDTNYFQKHKVYLSGVFWGEKLFSLDFQNETFSMNLSDLNQLGYEVTFINKCMAKFNHSESGHIRLIHCRPTSNQGSSGQRVNYNAMAKPQGSK